MALTGHRNVVPLVGPTIARRDRMIEHAVQSQSFNEPATQAAIRGIDRWLLEFAYDQVAEDYWKSRAE